MRSPLAVFLILLVAGLGTVASGVAQASPLPGHAGGRNTAGFTIPSKGAALSNRHLDTLADHLGRAATDAMTSAYRRGLTGASEQTVDGIRMVVVASSMTLVELADREPLAVHQIRPGVFAIERPIVVVAGASLFVSAPVKEIRLIDNGPTFAWLATRHGNLSLMGRAKQRITIRSWSPTLGRPDDRVGDGRPFITVALASRFDARFVDFSHLGFYEGRVSGVAVLSSPGLADSTGVVLNSTFSRNTYGAYAFRASHMLWRGNRFTDNLIYGLDPHDYSSFWVVSNNFAARNGRNGIIFSRGCMGNRIIDNITIDNGRNGIMIDDGRVGDDARLPVNSNHNVIIGNTSHRNGVSGIALDGGVGNVVRNNTLDGNLVGVRIFGHSSQDTVAGNRVSDSSLAGIKIDAPATQSYVSANQVDASGAGVLISRSTRATISGNHLTNIRRTGIRLRGVANTPNRQASISQNIIASAHVGISLSNSPGVSVVANDLRSTDIAIWLTRRSRNVRLLHNHIFGSRTFGILVAAGADGSVIRQNQVAGTRTGVSITASSNVVISANSILQASGRGVDVEGPGSRVEITENHLVETRVGLRVANGIIGTEISGNDLSVIGRVGILADTTSSRSRIHDNLIQDSRFAIRATNSSAFDAIEANTINRASHVGILIDRGAHGTVVRHNSVRGAKTGIAVRGAPSTAVAGNAIDHARSHAIEVKSAGIQVPLDVSVSGNTIEGHGPAPYNFRVSRRDAFIVSGDHVVWHYPFARDFARLLSLRIGPAAWLVLFLMCIIGPVLVAVMTRIGRTVSAVRRLLGGKRSRAEAQAEYALYGEITDATPLGERR